MPKFDIILTVFNRVDYTKRTVATLLSSGAFEACERFIIVDNRSTEEGMKEFLDNMAEYNKTFVIRRPQNDGWATAVNDALGLSRAEYVLISNNDVEFQPNFHEKLFETFRECSQIPPIGILGVWRHTSHSYTKNGWTNNVFREMDDVPAVAWMLPKTAMEKVGMLPEHGPCLTKGGNGEDSKYVQMMKSKGFLVGVRPEDVAIHIDGY